MTISTFGKAIFAEVELMEDYRSEAKKRPPSEENI